MPQIATEPDYSAPKTFSENVTRPEKAGASPRQRQEKRDSSATMVGLLPPYGDTGDSGRVISMEDEIDVQASISDDDEKLFDIHGCAANPYMTADQAAEYLGGLNSRTVTRWACEEYIPAIPIGEGKRRLWRFLTTDLDAWMTARKTGQIAA